MQGWTPQEQALRLMLRGLGWRKAVEFPPPARPSTWAPQRAIADMCQMKIYTYGHK